MKTILKNMRILPLAFLLTSCIGFPDNSVTDIRKVPLPVEKYFESYSGTITKSSLGASENGLFCWSVAAYRDGMLYDVAGTGSGRTYLELQIGDTYSIYALANTLNTEMFFEEIISEESLLGAVESFEFIPGYLPMSGHSSLYVSPSTASLPVVFTRLVAKYNVRIEQNFADPNASFEATGMRVCGTSVMARPFQKQAGTFAISAQSSSELGDEFDFASPADISSLNSGGSVALYTMENLQGTVPNSDPWRKNTSRPATWLELSGIWTTAGASAEMTYRMFLGANATDDFNVARNTSYNLTLSLSEDGFGHLGSSWKVVRTDFSDSRKIHVEGDWTTDRIDVYDDGVPVQYVLDKNYAGMDVLVSLECVDDAMLTLTRSGDVIELSTALRDCLVRPCDELVVSTRDGAELLRLPVTVWHRLDFTDFDLGGEATDPGDVTVGQKLVFSIGSMEVFPDEGYPLSRLGFRFGKYSTGAALTPHYFDVQDVAFGPGEAVLECWAVGEPGDLLYLEVYDTVNGAVLTRDGVFLVEKPSIRWVDWTGSGGYSATQPSSPKTLTLGGPAETLLLQYVSPRGCNVEFNRDLLQELDLEPDLSYSGNGYLSITPVYTTSFGDVNYPRQVYSVRVDNPHYRPQTVGSFIGQYCTGLADYGFRMPSLTATAPSAHGSATLPVELRLKPVDLYVDWSGNSLVFELDCISSAEVWIRDVTQRSELSFSVADAYSRLTAGVLTKDELFAEAVDYTFDYKLSDVSFVSSRGISGSRYSYVFSGFETALGENVIDSYLHAYQARIRGLGNENSNLWLNNSTMLQTRMSFDTHNINLGFRTSFPELFFPIGTSERVPFNILYCPDDVTLYLDGKPANH